MPYDFEIYGKPRNEDGTFKTFVVVYHTKSEDTGQVTKEENAYFNTFREVAVFLKQDRPEPLEPRIYQVFRDVLTQAPGLSEHDRWDWTICPFCYSASYEERSSIFCPSHSLPSIWKCPNCHANYTQQRGWHR